MTKTAANVGFWTDERVKLLRDHFAAGLSGRQSADLIGVTRNTVIAKRHRLGLCRHKPKNPKKAPTSVTIPRPKAVSGAGRPKLVCAPTPVPKPESLTVVPRPWRERESGQCAWPIGDGAEVFSCCAPVSRASEAWQYCDEHLQRMFARRAG